MDFMSNICGCMLLFTNLSFKCENLEVVLGGS